MKARKTRSFFNVRRAETQARCNIQTLPLCSSESVTRHLAAWGFHKNLLYREGKRALSPRSQSEMLEFLYFSNAQSRTHTRSTIVCIGGCTCTKTFVRTRDGNTRSILHPPLHFRKYPLK